MKIYRYYCRMRPPMPGTIPRGPINIEDYGERKHIYKVGCDAWGHVDYERELSPHEVYNYELVTGGMIDNVMRK